MMLAVLRERLNQMIAVRKRSFFQPSELRKAGRFCWSEKIFNEQERSAY